MLKGHLDEHPWNEKVEESDGDDEDENGDDKMSGDSDSEEESDYDYDAICVAGGFGAQPDATEDKHMKFASAREELRHLKVL